MFSSIILHAFFVFSKLMQQLVLLSVGKVASYSKNMKLLTRNFKSNSSNCYEAESPKFPKSRESSSKHTRVARDEEIREDKECQKLVNLQIIPLEVRWKE